MLTGFIQIYSTIVKSVGAQHVKYTSSHTNKNKSVDCGLFAPFVFVGLVEEIKITEVLMVTLRRPH